MKESERKLLVRDREQLRVNEAQQRSVLTDLLEEWQKSAHLNGHKKPRPLSLGNLPVSEALRIAMVTTYK